MIQHTQGNRLGGQIGKNAKIETRLRRFDGYFVGDRIRQFGEKLINVRFLTAPQKRVAETDVHRSSDRQPFERAIDRH